MKKIVTLMAFCFGMPMLAQVGINTVTPNAQLEIKSSSETAPANTDGLIIPKVNVFPSPNPTAAQQGMMVYLTTLSGTNQPGFYYWNNPTATWLSIGNGDLGWKVTGNAGTNPFTSYIGTSDNQDFVFRRNNIFAGRISSQNTSFGLRSGLANGGNNNINFGVESGMNNVIGSDNVFLGRSAGISNTSGSQNVFVGSFAGSTNTTGSNNIAIGNHVDLQFISGTNQLNIGNTIFGRIGAAKSVGINNNNPEGMLDVASATNGILIPRVALSTAILAAPVVNPQGGTLPTSTLVYNTATAGFSPNDVSPGFYYWTGTKWARFDANGENNPKYYTKVGTTNTTTNTAFAPMPEMSVTLTPNDNTVMVNFSAAGFKTTNACHESAVFFQILLNNIPVTNWQTAMKETIVFNAGPFGTDLGNPVWETSLMHPVAVTPGISQTISINWYSPICNIQNNVATPALISTSVFSAFRTLTVIDPNGGGGVVGTVPSATSLWALNGNAATNPNINFMGTTDNVDAVFRTNSVERLRIKNTGNIGMGTNNPLDRLHVAGNIRMVDGNQAAGKVLTSDGNGTGSWQDVSASLANWSLSGNSATNPAANFIGTIDNIDLVFKRFNLRSGLIGLDNTSFGRGALNATSTGHENTAVGNLSMTSNTFGEFNTAIGSTSLSVNTIGNFNTAVGAKALKDHTTGSYNTGLGFAALANSITGNNNTAVGSNAMQFLTSGAQNTVVDTNAFLHGNGSSNTAVGWGTMGITNSGSYNTAIGRISGTGGGSYNTALGDSADMDGTFTNATVIGSRAYATASNVVVLGSITGVNNALSSVNVGIGTTAPQAKLEIVDENAATTLTTLGNLFIRTNNPQGVNIGGAISLGGNNDDAGTVHTTFASIEGRKANSATGSNSGYLSFKTSSVTALGEKMRITSLGLVGIGTATPGGQFELSLDQGRKPGTALWTIVSDGRLKTIDGAFTKGLHEILQLHPIRYHYKNNGARKFEQAVLDTEFSGFLAQDVQSIFPEAVGTDGDGFLNFNMHSILVASINAFKELNRKNEQLASENSLLKSKIEAQTATISSILYRLENLETKP